MKLIKKIFILCTIIMMTGCLSMEQRKEKENIEKETKTIMIDYLEKNYNIKNVEKIKAKYSNTGDISNSYFLGSVTGIFQKNKKDYSILCHYNDKTCYDSYSYENIIMPILIENIEKGIGRKELKPEYVAVRDKYGFYNYCDDNIHGFFNNNDNISTFDEINSYYKLYGLKLIYKTQNKILENNINLFKN